MGESLQQECTGEHPQMHEDRKWECHKDVWRRGYGEKAPIL